MQRAEDNSTCEFRREAIADITAKFTANGYTNESIKEANGRRRSRQVNKPGKEACQLTISVPTINNKINGMIRGALKKANINARLVNPRPPTTLDLCRRSEPAQQCTMRKCPIPYLRCTTTYTVYMATCDICSNAYIGSTSRQPHYRAKEHIAEKFSDVSALGKHYRKSHSTMKADITFNIIQRTEHDELRLRIVEAYEIKTSRPTLNRKQEDLGIGSWHDICVTLQNCTPMLYTHARHYLIYSTLLDFTPMINTN